MPDNPDHAEPATEETVKAPAVKVSAPVEPTPEPRKPQFGDGVRYVDNREKADQTLDATVMVAFADGEVNLRVLDPANPFGHFDVARPAYDVEKHPGTWHFKDE